MIEKAGQAYLKLRKGIANVIEAEMIEAGRLAEFEDLTVASALKIDSVYPSIWVVIENATQDIDKRTNTSRYYTLNANLIVAFKQSELEKGESYVSERALEAYDVIESSLYDVCDFVRDISITDFIPITTDTESDVTISIVEFNVLYITKV